MLNHTVIRNTIHGIKINGLLPFLYNITTTMSHGAGLSVVKSDHFNGSYGLWSFVKSHDNKLDGLHITSLGMNNDITSVRLKITNCSFYGNGQYGVHVEYAPIHLAIVLSNMFENNAGVVMSNMSGHLIIDGTIFENNSKHAVHIKNVRNYGQLSDSMNISIINCTIKNTSPRNGESLISMKVDDVVCTSNHTAKHTVSIKDSTFLSNSKIENIIKFYSNRKCQSDLQVVVDGNHFVDNNGSVLYVKTAISGISMINVMNNVLENNIASDSYMLFIACSNNECGTRNFSVSILNNNITSNKAEQLLHVGDHVPEIRIPKRFARINISGNIIQENRVKVALQLTVLEARINFNVFNNSQTEFELIVPR